MIARDASPGLKLQFGLWLLAFCAAGGFALWMGLHGLLPPLRASAARLPVIAFRPSYAIGLPLAASFFALVVLALLPSPAVKRGGRRAPARRVTPTTFTFGIVVAGALLATVATPIARWFVTDALTRSGYRECPRSDAERRPPMRFARSGVRCP